MPERTDWFQLARRKTPPIPEDAVARIAPALDQLLDSFRPLLADLEHTTEPAVTLSERAVLGPKDPTR